LSENGVKKREKDINHNRENTLQEGWVDMGAMKLVSCFSSSERAHQTQQHTTQKEGRIKATFNSLPSSKRC